MIHAYVCAVAPKAFLHIGFREPTEPYPRIWIRTYSTEAMAHLTGVALEEGPDFMDYDLGMCKSVEAMDTLVAFLDTYGDAVNRIANTLPMNPTGEGQ